MQKFPACSCIILHIRKEGISFPLNLPHPSSSYTILHPHSADDLSLNWVVFSHFMLLRSNQPQTRDDEVWIMSSVCIQRFWTRSFQHTHKSKNELLTNKNCGKWMRQANEHATSFSHYVGLQFPPPQTPQTLPIPICTSKATPHLRCRTQEPNKVGQLSWTAEASQDVSGQW